MLELKQKLGMDISIRGYRKMNIRRLRTSLEVEELLNRLHNAMHLSSRAAIMRIGIGLSLRDDSIPSEFMNTDNKGFEISKQVLFGNKENIYEALIKMHYFNVNSVSNEEFSKIYFPLLVGAHIERGVRQLAALYKYAGNSEKLISELLNKLQ